MAENENQDPNNTNRNLQTSRELNEYARTLTEELKDQLGVRSRLNETERSTLSLARKLQRSASENNQILGNTNKIQGQITKDLNLQNKLESELESLKESQQAYGKDYSKLIEGDLKTLEKKKKLGQDEYIRAFSQMDAEVQRREVLKELVESSKLLVKQRQEEDRIQRKIQEKMGVSGALVEGTGALMKRLGMRSGIFHQAMEDASGEMKKMAEQSVRVDEETGEILKNYGRTQIMLRGLGKLALGFGKALSDPLSISLKIVAVLSEVNKAAVDFQRLTGGTASDMAEVNTEASTVVDLMQTAAEFTKQTGINARTIFTPKQLGQISDAKTLLGLSAEQGAQLGLIMKQTGRSVDSLEKNISASTEAGVSQKVVYEDILSASEDIVASAGSNEKALARAASKARKLGLNLSKVNDIADGLLNFESSIEAELEAQLLTGKAINLNKAREAALNNDLVTLTDELKKNGASAAEYAEMNRIQQQALAKALGMSRQELGKMVLTEKAMSTMTAKQIADARGMTLEQSRQLSIQEKLQKSLMSLAEPFVRILDVLNPIVSGISYILNIPLVPYLLLAAAAAYRIGKGFRRATKWAGELYSGVKNIVSNLSGRKLDGVLGKKKGLLGFFKSTKDAQKEAADATKGGGKGITGITKTIQKIDVKKILKGAAAMALVAGAIFVFAKALQEFEKIEDWKGIAIGLGTFAATMAVMGAIGNFAASGLTALAGGLGSLAVGLTTFGTAMIGPGGVGLLAIVGAAVGIGGAFALIGAGAMMFGKGIQFAASGVSVILDKIGSLTSMIPQLYLLGGALMSIAAGLASIAVSGLAAIPALAALSGFVMAATPIMALSGLFENNDKGNDNSEMIGLLKEIRNEVRDGGHVYLDGNKVGEALVLGSYISS